MTKEIIVGVVSALLASIITFIAFGSKEILDDVQLKKLSDKVIHDDSFIDVLLDKMSQDERFVPKDGRDGNDGTNFLIDSGVWDVRNNQNGGGCIKQGKDVEWSKKVIFKKKFKKSPTINYGISFIDIDTGSGAQQSNGVRAYISDVTADSFVIHAHSWMGCTYKVSISWLAIGE